MDRKLQASWSYHPCNSGTVQVDKIETIAFEDVEYRPEAGANSILRDINLKFQKGEIVGVCGANGSGKSVLLSLLAGNLTPSGGRILVNQHDLTDVDFWSLREQIAYLPRKHALLEGTIIDNLTRFDKIRYFDEAMDIASALGLDDYFAHHQSGLSAKIQTGVESGLSNTVLDSVALVAELLGRPQLILFDEANESLDSETDRRLLRFLQDRRGDAAIFIASNRERYHAICDRVFRIVDGKLTELPKTPVAHSDHAVGASNGTIGAAV